MEFLKRGFNVTIWPGAKIISSEIISLGNNVIIDDFVFLMGGRKTEIGDYVHIASFASITGGGELIMGDFSGLSSGVRVFTGHEDYKGSHLTNPCVPEPYRHAHRSFVHIGKHAVVGANSVILAGVTIGEGVAIGAGSLVTRDCKPWTIYAGVPVKEIGKRDKENMLKLEKKLREEEAKPLVSICCLTYNHKNLISDAIGGFLGQKTTFDYEILIHDDASTDGTQEVLEDWARRYPKIKLILQKENQYKAKGVYPINNIYSLAKGKYIAECDGDDYWTDTLKLQKQVDFLEANQDYVMCHHKYLIKNKDSFQEIGPQGTDYSQDQLIAYGFEGHGIGHCTKMWRNIYHQSKQTEQDFQDFLGDYSLNVMMGMYGNCKFLGGILPSVYRRLHGNNSWCSLNPIEMNMQIAKMQKKIFDAISKKGNYNWVLIRKHFVDNPIAVVEPLRPVNVDGYRSAGESVRKQFSIPVR